jgi:hypothetical protein
MASKYGVLPIREISAKMIVTKEFRFMKDWEPKHALGKDYKKINEIRDKCDVTYELRSGVTRGEEGEKCYGIIIFKGTKMNCDLAYDQMDQWLDTVVKKQQEKKKTAGNTSVQYVFENHDECKHAVGKGYGNINYIAKECDISYTVTWPGNDYRFKNGFIIFVGTKQNCSNALRDMADWIEKVRSKFMNKYNNNPEMYERHKRRY